MQNFNEIDIQVKSKGLWTDKVNPEEFSFMINVKNQSPFRITNVQLIITSIPQGVAIKSEKSYSFPELSSNQYKSANFKFQVSKMVNGGFLESVVTYYDPSEIMHTVSIKSFKIKEY